MDGMQYIIALVMMFYFFSFFFTILLIFRLIRYRLNFLGIAGAALASVLAIFLFFRSGWIYEIDFRTLVAYSLIIFVFYLLSRAFLKYPIEYNRKSADNDDNDFPQA